MDYSPLDPLILRVAGFTGTRYAITAFQRANLAALLAYLRPPEVHHGDCTGADAEAHMLARAIARSYIVIHPPSDPKCRALCNLHMPPGDGQTRDCKPYLDRNRDIVAESAYLIACPDERLRSGTRTTIGYAREAGIPVIILYPDGRAEVDGRLLAL